MIRAMVVAPLSVAAVLGLGMAPQAAAAQGLETASISALPAPRLLFSEREMQLAEAVAHDPGLADFYGSNGLKPVFLGPEGAARRQAVIAAVEQAASHGLPLARYRPDLLAGLAQNGGDTLAEELTFARVFDRWAHDLTGGVLDPQKVDPGIKRKVERPAAGDLLRGLVASDDPAGFIARLGPSDPRYGQLRQALAASAPLVAPPGTPRVPEGSWRLGDSGPAVQALRTRLAAMGFDAVPEASAEVFDAPLAIAVARFQAQAGMGADGIAGPRTVARLNRNGEADPALLVALERMRWMNGADPMARQVWVNLPEFTARILQDGQEVFSTRVVIGKADPEYETPEFSETMKYIVANPRWNVPRSITVKEYLPRLQANRNAVGHLDVVDGAGRVISRDRIDFRKYTASNFPYRMRQKPSDDNALGQVKFMFPNPWNIYLHDTPTKHLFNQSSRAYSHGCIRIGRPIDLAHELLAGQVGNPEATFQKALRSGQESFLNLRQPIPVHLVYFTAFPDADGQIRRFPDIYGRDAQVHAALTASAERAARDSGLDFGDLRD
ncbi:L,D-transpeptidase family protein [Paracoccus limosus]|uniref:L,D-transpeptidase family protein n=2 Tax=Paracoccus limosus TaxID=913252 RepID=A0A844H9C3_9RHOB|nr:L,D-transpeptidase family protein [Paracoccus limosus]